MFWNKEGEVLTVGLLEARDNFVAFTFFLQIVEWSRLEIAPNQCRCGGDIVSRFMVIAAWCSCCELSKLKVGRGLNFFYFLNSNIS